MWVWCGRGIEHLDRTVSRPHLRTASSEQSAYTNGLLTLSGAMWCWQARRSSQLLQTRCWPIIHRAQFQLEQGYAYAQPVILFIKSRSCIREHWRFSLYLKLTTPLFRSLSFSERETEKLQIWIAWRHRDTTVLEPGALCFGVVRPSVRTCDVRACSGGSIFWPGCRRFLVRFCPRTSKPVCSERSLWHVYLGPDLQNILRQSYDYLTTMPQ